MRRSTLTGKRAVWMGLLATPVLVIAAVTLIGVTGGSAGPSAPGARAAGPLPKGAEQVGDFIMFKTNLGEGVQTFAQLENYWTPERMANAKPLPMPAPDPASNHRTLGSIEAIPLSSGESRWAIQMPNGSVHTGTVPETSSVQTFTEAHHSQVPFDRWEYFAKYLPVTPGNLTTNPNRAISTVHKMFFTAASGGDFVCSSSTIGSDAVWTAGHCVADPGVGFSTNVFFCPSYDNGVNANQGCWGADELFTTTGWFNDANLSFDFGAADSTETGSVHATIIGSRTGINGILYAASTGFGPSNRHWVAIGYPAASPFTGGKIEMCASQLGYADDDDAGLAGTGVAIGCDMTGGSSGGPWLAFFGKVGQPGGAPLFPPGFCCALLNGLNSWGHVGGGAPAEMVSPYFNCTAIGMWWLANDITPGTCP